MPESEYLSVLVHEFGHYFDIYSFQKNRFGDESEKFYTISWSTPTSMKSEMRPTDFVSGYAMTNQYEDFAESYVYYILHNRAFLQKASQSPILAQKYAFFQTYVFEKNEFYKQNFSLPDEPVKNYYWDITKIDVDVKNFLQYMRNSL